MWHGGWWRFIEYDEQKDKPRVTRTLLRRVAEFARPYFPQLAVMLIAIFASSLI